MNAPVLLWTFRRTGGTAFAGLLGGLLDRKFLHEPFNRNRVFHEAVASFDEHGDEARLRRNVRVALDQGRDLKHCFDILPMPLHSAVFDVATELGYAHVVLDRRCDVDRVISLELARQTGAWGPKAAKERYPEILSGQLALAPLSVQAVRNQLKSGQHRRDWLATRLRDRGVPHGVAMYEDIFGGRAGARASLVNLLGAIGVDPDSVDGLDERLREMLDTTSQQTNRLHDHVPGLRNLREELLAEPLPPNPWTT